MNATCYMNPCPVWGDWPDPELARCLLHTAKGPPTATAQGPTGGVVVDTGILDPFVLIGLDPWITA